MIIPALGVGPLGASEWSIGGAGAIGPVGGSGATSAAGGSFGNVLSSAIDSLDQTQASAAQASQGLATGKLTDPTQAITAVENASLSMDLAAQLRNKLTEATQTIFQTQI